MLLFPFSLKALAAASALAQSRTCASSRILVRNTPTPPLYPVQLHSATEDFRGWCKHRFLT